MKKFLKNIFIQYQVILATLLLIFISVFCISFVYKRMLNFTSEQCWKNLNESSHVVSEHFSNNLQYQSLMLQDYANIMRKNEIKTEQQIRDFKNNYILSSALYDLYIILPDSMILGPNGTEIDARSQKLFQKECSLGEHFSGIENNLSYEENNDFNIIRHYYPVEVGDKCVAILYFVLELDFYTNNDYLKLYENDVDYIVFNPKTKDIYINTMTEKYGSVYSYINRLSGVDVFNLFEKIENRQECSFYFTSNYNNKKLYLYSMPTSYENFSLCLFSEYNVIFDDVLRFKRMSIIVISIMTICYLIYLRFMFRYTKDKIEKSVLEERLNKAENATKAKTMFLSTISHDIRTPINAIVGYTNLALLHIDKTYEVKRYLSKELAACNHLLSLINEILDMSRIETGKIKIKNEPANLLDLIHEIENIVNVQLHAKDIQFNLDTSEVTNPYVQCDKIHLNQILLNILGNAIKFTETGGVVSFTVRQNELDKFESKGEAEYHFIIKDNGMGMSPEFMRKLYEPFERQDSAKVSGIQGSGLGLAITKRLTELMGGRISIKSIVDKGTEVSVVIKLKLIDNPVSTEINSVNTNLVYDVPVVSDVFASKKILLAEDNDFNREIASELLRMSGFYVDEVTNGKEALEKIASSNPGYYAVVLMDIQMPIMNGYEATRAIRQLKNEELANIPVIALSANAYDEDLKMAEEAQMNGYVTKPVSEKKLFKVLGDIINKK